MKRHISVIYVLTLKQYIVLNFVYKYQPCKKSSIQAFVEKEFPEYDNSMQSLTAIIHNLRANGYVSFDGTIRSNRVEITPIGTKTVLQFRQFLNRLH